VKAPSNPTSGPRQVNGTLQLQPGLICAILPW
jgi:hypothetical protein